MNACTDFQLPQTNLQLYRLLIERGASEEDLVLVRDAYDLARCTFATRFRPSHKPFLCHLVGTAGALVMWQQRIPLVVAGLIHAVYFLGDFGDGQTGATQQRRDFIHQKFGSEIEDLVYQYSQTRWEQSMIELHEECREDKDFRELATIKLADTLDEIVDGGLMYSNEKEMRFGLQSGQDVQKNLIEPVAGIVTAQAAENFSKVLHQNALVRVPENLKSSDRMSKEIETGVRSLRMGRVQKRLGKWKVKIHKKLQHWQSTTSRAA